MVYFKKIKLIKLKISIAGPAVNLFLAGVLFIYTLTTQSPHSPTKGIQSASLPEALLIANLTLALFNMLPAFPMDGGRVLRAALGLRLSESRSTQIAGGIGQALAIVLGIVGLFTQGYILMLIAFFVFMGASQEIQATVARSILHGHSLSDVMQTQFETLMSGESLQSAANRVIHGSQRDFPVMNGEEVLGILTRSQLADGLATDGESAYVAGWMQRHFKSAKSDLPLEEAVELFTQADTTPLLVFDGDRLIGMASLENISQFVMLEHAKARGRNHAAS
jgi:predicted transcriptional regulator